MGPGGRLLVELASGHGTHQSYDTPFVFVGNNRYAVAGLEIGTRTTLDGGKLRSGHGDLLS